MTDRTENNSQISSLPDVERILCPIDLLGDSDQALRYSTALARTYGAKLFLCNCVGEPLPDGGKRAKEHLAEMIRPFAELVDTPAINWQSIITEGRPGESIVRVAVEHQIDLIVMNSRRRPIAASLLGSTAEEVCRTALCPVLIMHQHEREWVNAKTGRLDLKRMLVAYDYSYYSEQALSYALSLCRKHNCALYLLHVLPIRSDNAFKLLTISAIEEETDRLRNAVPSELYSGFEIKPIVGEGEAYDQILAYSEENKMDLICIGARGAGKRAILGSTVDRVLREAICPVLVARPLKRLESLKEKRSGMRVLIAVDGSEYSEAALRSAVERAWPPGTELRVITVMEPLSTLGPTATHYKFRAEVFNALNEMVVNAAGSLSADGRTVSHTVREGWADDQIITEAKEWGADLILVGTHGRRGLSRFFLGSVAEHVAAYAPCSVEIVRKRAEADRIE